MWEPTDPRSSTPLESPSQLLGLRLAELEFEGAICPSSIETDSSNLVVFVRNVDPAQSLHVVGSG
jgi:hypothetical protein